MRRVPVTDNRKDWPRLVSEAVSATQQRSLNGLVVKSINDLPTPVGDEIVLPTGNVFIAGDINLGANALRLSTGTLLRGFGGNSIISSNPSGVIRATNLDAAVVMREFTVIATGGPCLALEGTTDYQLNLFFMALIGAAPGTSVGTVSGFDVQAFKDCYFNAPDGLTVTGTTNKILISQCPFYGIAAGNAAITLDAALNARRIDMVTNFFKHDAAGIPLRAEVGYTVNYGRVFGSMLDGPTVMLDGLASEDDNWFFDNNDLVRNSRVAAESYLTASATTVITTTGVFVPITGSFNVTTTTQRFASSGTNQLEYTGKDPVLVTFSASITTDPAFSDEIAFRAEKNGTTLAPSEIVVVQGSGTAAQPRNGFLSTLIELEPGDIIGLEVANLTSTNDVPLRVLNFSVIA